MSLVKIILAGFTAGLLLTFCASAQTATNAPATIIENFELQPGTVIVKAFNTVGTIAVNGGVISVRAKESDDVNHSQKVFGIAIGWSGGDKIPKGFMAVDYDELDSLISGINYISNVTYDVTSLSAFEASYATKSGVRIIAHSDRRNGGINAFLQFGDWPRIPLNADQLAQLKNLISQAKAALDALK